MEDRPVILEKIKSKEWAKASFDNIKKKVDSALIFHQKDRNKFLREFPLDWNEAEKGAIPPLTYTTTGKKGKHQNLDNATDKEMANFFKLANYLELALEAGLLYYLEANEAYAQLATDILYTAVMGIIQLEPSDWKPRGGWLCPDDILRESRVIGEKFPIVYDFVSPYIVKGNRPFDIGKLKEVDFPIEKAQEVFRNYARLVVDNGMINSNHPVLESNCLVYNALALEDIHERNHFLEYYLTKNTPNQDALAKVAEYYKKEGDIWPESSQYTNDVAARSTKLMYLLTKYDPTLQLGKKYPNIPWALQRLDYLVNPNGELLLWGDGHRKYRTPYHAYELAYKLGKLDSVPKLEKQFGSLLSAAISEGRYLRKGLEALLWFHDDFEQKETKIVLPRTDEQPHAGIFLQRNLSATGNPNDGLMCFVGGAPMVHGHASGMNIELYGEGVVLGVDNGRGKYAQDIHENYSRIFAAHNTVIVNGASQGEGSWVNLGIDTVALKAMEPMPKQQALSPNYSFTTTNFYDGGGTKSEAYQQRTMALIRTSPTTGFYLDIFRSKSKLSNEYHDYLYHNLGESLDFLNPDLVLELDPNRFMANAQDEWIRNRKYRNPGWHFFKDVWSSEIYTKDIQLLFKAEGFQDKKRYMKVFMPGFEGRTYTKVMAPKTFEAPAPYDMLPTPTLVVRQKGEAHTKPFVAVYEPYTNNSDEGSIRSVEKLVQNGLFQGVKVTSTVRDELLVQYILTPFENGVVSITEQSIEFQGHFAIVSFDGNNNLKDIYIGNGSTLKTKSYSVEPTTSKMGNGFIDFTTEAITIKGDFKLSSAE
ncbi:MAG: heparinase II/III family protein [Bacteroidota bacterium]